LFFVKIFLLPVSLLYGFVIVLRNWMFDHGLLHQYKVDVPVISVGNLTVGGTGKTPIVEYIVNELLESNYRVAVVSRGYKRASRGTVVVSDGHAILANPEESGDEPFQIARKFQTAVVVVDEDRVRGARVAIDQCGAQVVVLDDGFQHRRLGRDLDILVVDVARPPFKELLLPAGLRREPMMGTRRAHAIVFSRWLPNGDSVKQTIRRKTNAPMFDVKFVPNALVRLGDGFRFQTNEVRGKSCYTFCGIAQPEVFEQTVGELGLQIKGRRIFPDHYPYSSKDLGHLKGNAEELGVDFLLTTEKDAVRLMNPLDDMKRIIDRLPLYYVELETRFSDSASFSDFLKQRLGNNAYAHSDHR
jgi:tetraacyldisaccharide 4'-kinase